MAFQPLLTRLSWWLHQVAYVTPHGLSLSRPLGAVISVLLIFVALKQPSALLVSFTFVLYGILILTDALDGPLAREMQRLGIYDTSKYRIRGEVLDRICDKIFIIVHLLPFHPIGIPFCIGEAYLAWLALRPDNHDKKAKWPGKLKMIGECFLVPMLFIHTVWPTTFSLLLSTLLYLTTAFFMCLSIWFYITMPLETESPESFS